MPKRIVLGVDPGYADAGYGIIETDGLHDRCLAYGSLKTPAGQPFEERLLSLHDGLKGIIQQYKPVSAGIEKLYFAKNVKTAIAVAEARGVIRLCLIQNGVPCREYGPGEVKSAVTGYGSAPKPQMQKMVKTLLGLKDIPKPDDAADALAMAITAAHDQLPAREKKSS